MKGLFTKLGNVQKNLNAPKNQFNLFGKYKYRSCEDILEVAKPLCLENGLVLTVSDTVVLVGERYYIEATCTVTEMETGLQFTNTASARESENKKGMDDSQITGTASSYARKYSLNGLFCIDDTKDADTDEHKNQQSKSPSKTEEPTEKKVSTKQLIDTAKAKDPKYNEQYLIEKYNKENNKHVDKVSFISAECKKKYFLALGGKL